MLSGTRRTFFVVDALARTVGKGLTRIGAARHYHGLADYQTGTGKPVLERCICRYTLKMLDSSADVRRGVPTEGSMPATNSFAH